MASINTQRTSTTTKIFDKFYNVELVVDNNEYDLVNSYFKAIMVNAEISDAFTAQVFFMAKQTGVSAQTYLNSIKGQDAQTLTMSMAYYMNQTRSRSTLLGVGQVVTPKYYAARNVLP